MQIDKENSKASRIDRLCYDITSFEDKMGETMRTYQRRISEFKEEVGRY